MTSELVSVIYITRNRLSDLMASIESVMKQDLKDFEIIVVDQGSSDSTCDFIRMNYPEVKLIELRENYGVAGGRNIGAKYAKGKYLVFVDDDTILHTNVLKKLRIIFDKNSCVGIVAFNVLEYSTNEISNWGHSNSMKLFANSYFETIIFPGCGHAVRRDLFEKVGGYDEELFFWGDELSLSLKLIRDSSYKIVYAPDIVVWHRFARSNRVRWESGRMYYKVRNRLLLTWWYFPGIIFKVVFSLAYLATYAFKSMLIPSMVEQFFKGIRDFAYYIRRTHKDKKPLSYSRFFYYIKIFFMQRIAIVFGKYLILDIKGEGSKNICCK